jgi:CO/xanthine dehydrogenase FAD-binding subunit
VKPAVFNYSAPENVAEALGLLAEHGSEAKVLAGGQSLVPMLNFRLARPAHLIDINAIDSLSYVSANGSLRIGALTRLTTVQESDEVASAQPIIPEAVSYIGHRAIRNRGTIGGSLAHNDPAAEIPALLMALDAEVTAASTDGERVIGAGDLIEDRLFDTTLGDTELLTEIRIPAARASSGFGFQEFARRHGDFALAGVAAVISVDGSTVREASLAAFGGTHATRLPAAEAALVGAEAGAAAFAAAGDGAAAEFPTTSDIHGSGEYRRHLIKVLTMRALAEAASNAGGENG